MDYKSGKVNKMFGVEDNYILQAMKRIRSSKLFKSVSAPQIAAIALMIKHNGSVSNDEMVYIVKKMSK
jgi:hypothetical protein